jgi:hypothetical protein
VKTEQANLKASPTATHSASVRSSHPEQTVGAGDFGDTTMTIDYYYQLTYRRINARYQSKTIARHESRLIAAVEMRKQQEAR